MSQAMKQFFLINFWTPKNIWDLGGYLYHILKRTTCKIYKRTIYKILERMIWVKLYGLLVRICKIYWKTYNIKPSIPFFIKVDQFFLKELYGSIHIILDSDFSNDAWNRNKTWAFDGNLYFIYKLNILC